jgi:Spherulation-specific family 4
VSGGTKNRGIGGGMDRKVIEQSAANGRVLRKYCMGALFLSAFPLFANATELVVPAYFDPTAKSALWTQLVTTAAANPTTVIMNPDNGPGNTQNPAYISAIAKVRAAGGKVIGYVSTRSTKRALSTVVADINKYMAFYKIDGIFVDEMTSDSVISHIQYYQSVYNYVKGLSANYTVMGNPGTNTQELYVSLPTVDKIVVFEDTAKHYAKFAPSAWQANYPKSRFVNMVYTSAADQLPTVMSYAAAHGAGGVFVTSEAMPNPYKGLPAYWSTEITKARSN